MASEPNRTCTFSEAPRPVGAAFKIYNLAFVGAALAILVPSILLWYVDARKYPGVLCLNPSALQDEMAQATLPQEAII